jgi:hypothetical protein
MSVVTVQNRGVAWLGCGSDAKTHRENEILFRHCERHDVVRSNPVRGATLDCFVASLLAMTMASIPLPHCRGEERML